MSQHPGNPPWSVSLAALIHPASLVAIAVLLLNDHFLKYAAPSWLTGKLSDFAGLFIAPYVCLAVVLALLSFTRPRLSATQIAFATYFAIGVLFTTLKVSTEATDFFVSVLAALTGQRISLVVDPSDLIALIALPASYLLLGREGRRAHHTARRRPLFRALVLCAATVAMAATSGPPPPSVTSIAVDRVDGNLLYAVVEDTQDKDGLYVSSDGGGGWVRVSTTTGQVIADPVQNRTAYILDAPSSQSGLLRLRVGARPVEIGPGTGGVGTYLTDATSLSVGQWPSPVLYFVFHGVLWVSEDGAVTWQKIGLGEPVHALAPTTTPGLAYAATYGYLIRSTDGGKAWTHVIVLPGTGDVTALAVHKDDPLLLLAGIGKELRRSTDGGLTWSLTLQYGGSTRVEFAHWTILLDPQDPERAYALFGSGCCAPVISTDRGLTWTEWGDALSALALTTDRRSPLLAVDPFGTSLLRHVGTPPGMWERVGEKLPLGR
jgi:BNR/Asp-box repeat.